MGESECLHLDSEDEGTTLRGEM